MAKTMDAFLADVLPICPGVPDYLVEQHTRSALIQFCKETRAFRRELDPLQTIAGIYEYDIEVPVYTTVHEIESIVHEGEDLVPRTIKQVEQITLKWREERGTPQVYIRKPNNLVWLVPVPDTTATNAIIMNVSLKPTQDAQSFEDELYDEYHEPILNLILSRLLRIPKKDWTDVAASNRYFALYAQEVQDAEIRGRKAQRGSAPTVRYGGIGADESSTRTADYGHRTRRF